jgi:hypothetical protein
MAVARQRLPFRPFTWVGPYHSIRVPDHLAAGSRSYGSRLGCPRKGGGYVVPGLMIPVGYGGQNSRCWQPILRSQHRYLGDFVAHPNDLARQPAHAGADVEAQRKR